MHVPETQKTTEGLGEAALQQEIADAIARDPDEKVLILMVGLPYSGKTTKAKGMGHPIVSPDAIRLALHGQRHRKESEPLVWAHATLMVDALFRAGHTYVVLDACNVSKKRRDEWECEAWRTVHVLMESSRRLCLARAIEAGDDAIKPIITRMAENFEWPGTWRP